MPAVNDPAGRPVTARPAAALYLSREIARYRILPAAVKFQDWLQG
jgi:hypothetical protein